METRVGKGNRRGATGRVKGLVVRLRRGKHNLVLIQLANRSGELVALDPLEQQLRNFLAPLLVLGRRGRLCLLLILVLVVDGFETVTRVSLGVRLFFLLGFDLPDALFLEGQCAPTVTDDL